MRIRWPVVGLLICLGCRAPGPARLSSLSKSAAEAEQRPEKQRGLVQAGYVEQAADDLLDQAAACIERGDTAGAMECFRDQLRRYPEQIMIRAYLAELLLKASRLPEAQDQYERFIAAAQESDGPARDHIVHCHTRLMTIAQARDDDYAEHLHRGIGMVLLARQLEKTAPNPEAEPGFRERLLCKAAGELKQARTARPDEPRPLCYLAEVWTKLNQPRPAENALRQARALAPLVALTPSERRSLALAR